MIIIIIHSRPRLSKKCSKVAPTSRMDSTSRQGQMTASHSPTLSYLSSGTEVGFTNVHCSPIQIRLQSGTRLIPYSIPKRHNWTTVSPSPRVPFFPDSETGFASTLLGKGYPRVQKVFDAPAHVRFRTRPLPLHLFKTERAVPAATIVQLPVPLSVSISTDSA